jgi:hypothetical protein
MNMEPFEDLTEPRTAGSATPSGVAATLGVALLRNLRKTERGAGLFLIRLAVRAAPFALPAGRGSVFVRFYMAFHFYVPPP